MSSSVLVVAMASAHSSPAQCAVVSDVLRTFWRVTQGAQRTAASGSMPDSKEAVSRPIHSTAARQRVEALFGEEAAFL